MSLPLPKAVELVGKTAVGPAVAVALAVAVVAIVARTHVRRGLFLKTKLTRSLT